MPTKKNKTSSVPMKLLPIITVLCIMPLIVYAKIIDYDTSSLAWYTSESTPMVDIFNHYKALILLITSVVMFILLVFKALDKSKPVNHRLYIPTYIYSFLIILSTFFSINLYYSTNGYINHLENIYVLLAYMVVLIYTAEYISDTKELKLLVNGWIISILILFLIGLTQFFSVDLYRTDFGMKMIIPSSIQSMIAGAEFTLWSDNLIYQSLFHYNYVSFYAALAFPFFLALVIGAKRKKERILYLTVCMVLLFNLFGSQGRNGFVGVVVGSIIVLLLFGPRMFLNKYVISTIIVLTTSTALFVAFTDTILENRIISAFTELNDHINYPLNSITTDTSAIVIDHDDFHLIIKEIRQNENIVYLFEDETGTKIKSSSTDNQIFLDTSNNSYDYSAATFQTLIYQGYNVLQINLEGIDWNFIHTDTGLFYLNPYGNIETLEHIPSIGFEGNERWGSKRGYIWSRTLPMILEKPILGSGPDTYAYAFPQNDYVGKMNAYGANYINTVVDKPHNIYLNYAANTGLFSLLAFIGIIIVSLWRTFRYILNTTSSGMNDLKVYTIASAGSIVAYLSAGFFNDTSLHVTPIFWIIVGINYATCTLLSKS